MIRRAHFDPSSFAFADSPYPDSDGTVFADEVHEFSVKDGSDVEGPTKSVTVMFKDLKKYP